MYGASGVVSPYRWVRDKAVLTLMMPVIDDNYALSGELPLKESAEVLREECFSVQL